MNAFRPAFDAEASTGGDQLRLDFKVCRRPRADGDPSFGGGPRGQARSRGKDKNLGFGLFYIRKALLPDDSLLEEMRGQDDPARGDQGEPDAAKNRGHLLVRTEMKPSCLVRPPPAQGLDGAVHDDDRLNQVLVGRS